MMAVVRLDDVEGFGEDVDALFRAWREAIEGAHNWSATGPGVEKFSNLPASKALHVKAGGGLRRAVVTTAIPAAPSAGAVSNAGRATLRERTGTTLADGATGQVVYSDFATAVAVGKRILVAPDGDGWLLVSADCP
jgi:hypothetical protein